MRLIDADKLREMMDEQYPFDKATQSRHDAFDIAKSAMIKLLYDVPIVDVAERKKGKWIKRGRMFQCPECGRFTTVKENYCPNCGLDNREEKTDDGSNVISKNT